MHAAGRIHDLLRHFVFSHAGTQKTLSRKDAKIAKKTSRICKNPEIIAEGHWTVKRQLVPQDRCQPEPQ